MDGLWIIVGATAGVIVGAALVWLFARSRIETLQSEKIECGKRASELDKSVHELTGRAAAAEATSQRVPTLESELQTLRAELSEIEKSRSAIDASLRERERNLKEQMETFEDRVKQAFDAISKSALEANSNSFMRIATQRFDDKERTIDALIKPLAEKIKEYDQRVLELKEFEVAAKSQQKEIFDSLKSELQQQSKASQELRSILKGSAPLGKVAEIFLKRLLDEAGLTEKIHYELQVHAAHDDGNVRFDAIVKLPSNKVLIIDSKAPMTHFERAMQSDDPDIRKSEMRQHAQAVRDMIKNLSSKDYLSKVEAPVDHVVAYFAFESALNAAVETEPDLVSHGWSNRVICLTPTNLYVLLRMVAISWEEEKRAQSIEHICKLGAEVVDRTRIVADKFRGVGSNLDKAVRSYNEAVASMESNLLTTGYKFQKLAIGTDKKLLPLKEIEVDSREFKKPELHSLPNQETLDRLEEIEIDPLPADADEVAEGFDFEDEPTTS